MQGRRCFKGIGLLTSSPVRQTDYICDVLVADLTELLAEMHSEVVQQVLEDLRSGDRKARSEAMQLLKQNNVQAVAAQGTALSKLAGKLNFDSVQGKVIEFKPPISAPQQSKG